MAIRNERGVEVKKLVFRLGISPQAIISLLLAMSLALTMFLAWRGFRLNEDFHQQVARSRVQTMQIEEALCTFRQDLERRVRTSEKFLEEHPGPEPIPNLSRETILRGLVAQRNTVASLASLRCIER